MKEKKENDKQQKGSLKNKKFQKKIKSIDNKKNKSSVDSKKNQKTDGLKKTKDKNMFQGKKIDRTKKVSK